MSFVFGFGGAGGGAVLFTGEATEVEADGAGAEVGTCGFCDVLEAWERVGTAVGASAVIGAVAGAEVRVGVEAGTTGFAAIGAGVATTGEMVFFAFRVCVLLLATGTLGAGEIFSIEGCGCRSGRGGATGTDATDLLAGDADLEAN